VGEGELTEVTLCFRKIDIVFGISKSVTDQPCKETEPQKKTKHFGGGKTKEEIPIS
jgi:hypothetical protein